MNRDSQPDRRRKQRVVNMDRQEKNKTKAGEQRQPARQEEKPKGDGQTGEE